MWLFFLGFAAGTLFTTYLCVGADRAQRLSPLDAALDHGERWKYQRPLPPF